jgi:formiminotetrahydrofolate cyclodeaminase
MAAALGSMVTRLAKLDPTPFEADRHFFTEAVDRDAEAFNQVMDAYKRPKDERGPHVEAALHGAAVVPLEVMERSHHLAARLDALDIPAKFASDLAVARSLAAAARAGAWANVRINLDSIHDAEFKAALDRRVDALWQPADKSGAGSQPAAASQAARPT